MVGMVVGGEVTTVAQLAKWTPWMVVRWTRREGYLGAQRIRLGRASLGAPSLMELLEDPAIPIALFAKSEFDIAHGRGIRATLLVVAATETRDSVNYERLQAARRLSDAMPLRIRALLLIAENVIAGVPVPDEMPTAARQLAEAGAREADDPYLWAEVATFYMFGERANRSEPSERLPYMRRLAAAAPRSAAKQWGLGACLLAVGEELLETDDDMEAYKTYAREAITPLQLALRKRQRTM